MTRLRVGARPKRDGSYYLTHHRWAGREQLLACYPQFQRFLALKRRYNPGEVLHSDWYAHHRDSAWNMSPAA